jgi:hypothetical protein
MYIGDMEPDELTEEFGAEYPIAINCNGIRYMPYKETSFSRHYSSEDKGSFYVISKFMDGSSTITNEQLRGRWRNWSEQDRLDFCQSCSWLGAQSDYPDMLRFIMEHGNVSDWSALALSVANHLPQEESYRALVVALSKGMDNCTSNITQAIAETGHPEAAVTISHVLDKIWFHPDLWNEEPSHNGRAIDAICCVDHLLELCVSSSSLENKVRQLSLHKSSFVRNYCRETLSQYYSWLKPE